MLTAFLVVSAIAYTISFVNWVILDFMATSKRGIILYGMLFSFVMALSAIALLFSGAK